MQIRNCCFYNLRTYFVFPYFARLGKTQKSLALLSFSQKLTAYEVSKNKFTSWLLRGVKPSAGSGLERPNSPNTLDEVFVPGFTTIPIIKEFTSISFICICLRATPILTSITNTKTANSNSVYIQLV